MLYFYDKLSEEHKHVFNMYILNSACMLLIDEQLRTMEQELGLIGINNKSDAELAKEFRQKKIELEFWQTLKQLAGKAMQNVS